MQHRHAPSYRCQTCWISCKTKDLAQQHHTGTECVSKEKPTLIMSAAQESLLEERTIGDSPEAKWWTLFCIAYTHLPQAEVDRLKSSYPYFPCRFLPRLSSSTTSRLTMADYPDTTDQGSLVFPSMVFDTSLFDPALDLEMLGELQMDTDNLFSRDIQVPLFHIPPAHPLGAMPISPTASQARDITFTTQPSLGSESNPTGTLYSAEQSTGATSSATTLSSRAQSSPGTTVDASQTPERLRQNVERLHRRVASLEGEVTNMAEGSRRNLRSLDRIFEDIFQLEELPVEVFQKMTEASEILSLMKRKLR